jgi:GAF domain-containing protein
MGVGAQMAMHLYDHNQSLGGLNLYFNKPRSISADSADIAGLFATHAAIVMGHAREVDTLKKALNTRKVIGAAIGIIMERYELDEDSAFQFLIRMSQTHNVKLRLVADEIVTGANAKFKNKLN